MADLNTSGVSATADMDAVKAAVASGSDVIDGSALMREEESAAPAGEEEAAGLDAGLDTVEEEDAAAPAEGEEADPKGDEEESEHPAFTQEAFTEAEAGTTFKDANGRLYEKVEGVDLPVPRCDTEAPIYKELKNFGFDQDVINREFWMNKGDVSEDTLKSLKDVFPAGMVDEFFAAKKAEHLAYLDSLSRQNSDAEKAKAAAIERQTQRDNETLDITASVFGSDDGKAKFDEVVGFINANYELARRKEIAASLSGGTVFVRKALMQAIKRDMEYAGGDVHKLLNADGVVSVAKVGGKALSGSQFHDIVANPSNPDHKKYHSDPAFAAEIDARRSKGIELGV